MENAWNNYVLPALVPSLLIAVMLLLAAILYNIRRTRTMKAANDVQQRGKEPEEHDERFATGKHAQFRTEGTQIGNPFRNCKL